jgi:hypothetical protein
MREERRWSLIPRSRAQCLVWGVVGVLLLARTIWTMTDGTGYGVLDIVAAVLAGVVIICSVLGLVVPRLRER